MPFDEPLAERIQALIGKRRGLTEKRMFGGLAFMLDGNMCCGVMKDRIMLRLGPEGVQAAVVMINLSDAVWWRYPWVWKMSQALYGLASFVIAGAVLGKFIQPQKAA